MYKKPKINLMKNLFTLLIGIILFVTANAQTPQLAWAKTFGNKSAATDSTSVMKLYTADNSVYIAGTSDAFGKGNDKQFKTLQS